MGMKGWRTKLKGGDEWDTFSPWRKFLCYLDRPGVTKWIKRKHNKRARKKSKIELTKEDEWFI